MNTYLRKTKLDSAVVSEDLLRCVGLSSRVPPPSPLCCCSRRLMSDLRRTSVCFHASKENVENKKIELASGFFSLDVNVLVISCVSTINFIIYRNVQTPHSCLLLLHTVFSLWTADVPAQCSNTRFRRLLLLSLLGTGSLRFSTLQFFFLCFLF